MLTDIFKEVLLSGLVDGKGEKEDNREPASLMKQESKDGVQYNPLDAGALVEGGKVIGQNSFKMAGQVTSNQPDNEDKKAWKNVHVCRSERNQGVFLTVLKLLFVQSAWTSWFLRLSSGFLLPFSYGMQ